MSDDQTQNADTNAGAVDGATAPAVVEFEPITSQDDLNKRIAARLERERGKFADYADLKTKASKFDELEEANKSELQRIAEQRDQLERDLKEERTARGRSDVAAAKGVPASALLGSTPEEWEASADELIAWRSQTAPTPPPIGVHVPGEGKSSSLPSLDEQIAEAQKAGDITRAIHLKRQRAQTS